MRRGVSALLGALVLGVLGAAEPAHAASVLIDFDAVVAPPFFTGVAPGGSLGPILAFPDVILDGGVILNESGWAGGATTNPNLYATANLFPLSDGSLLPGVITGTFVGTVSSISLDMINGISASLFTLTAFDASNVQLASMTVPLSNFSTAGFVAPASVAAGGIKKFTVTSAQTGLKDFAIDTLRFETESLQENVIPEPATLLLMGFGGLGAWVRRRPRVRLTSHMGYV